jgi:hypothetical protein
VAPGESLRRQSGHRLTRRGQIAMQTAEIIVIRGCAGVFQVISTHQSLLPPLTGTEVETRPVQDFFPPPRRV